MISSFGTHVIYPGTYDNYLGSISIRSDTHYHAEAIYAFEFSEHMADAGIPCWISCAKRPPGMLCNTEGVYNGVEYKVTTGGAYAVLNMTGISGRGHYMYDESNYRSRAKIWDTLVSHIRKRLKL